MKKEFVISLAISFATCTAVYSQKYEELAKTPPMGWSSWNKFNRNINEQNIKEIADAMVSSGLKDCGYEYLNLDDCWHGERDSLGFIHGDPNKFPKGMKELADYIHSKGLKFGLYSDAGCLTCAGAPGSLGHEYQDAMTYAEWGVDYLKYDWCNTPDLNTKGSYRVMRDALYKAGRPIVFSICEWGNTKPWTWGKEIGHMWRTAGDIGCEFDCFKNYGDWSTHGVMQIVDQNEPLRHYAGPGHWNDPDMLEVGNGMSEAEDRSHFTLWCMMASPLILGNDIRDMNDATKSIIMNKEVIAIDQDPLGVQGWRFFTADGVEYWYKPLINDEWALCVFNRSNSTKKVILDWYELATFDNVTKRSFKPSVNIHNIRNLWKKEDEGTTDKNKEIIIPSHDVVLYRFTPAKK